MSSWYHSDEDVPLHNIHDQQTRQVWHNRFCLCDASVSYASNPKIYEGRQPGSAYKKNLGQNIVLHLTEPLQGSGRNVNGYIFYHCKLSLARKLLQHRLIIVGTTRKYKRKMPECMKAAKSRQQRHQILVSAIK